MYVCVCIYLSLSTQAPLCASVLFFALAPADRGSFARTVAGMAALRWADMYDGSGDDSESVGFGHWESKAPQQNGDEEAKEKTKDKRPLGNEEMQWVEEGELGSAAFSQELPLKIEPGSSEQQLAGRLYQAVCESSDLELRVEARGDSKLRASLACLM